jgi:hypothetical protein
MKGKSLLMPLCAAGALVLLAVPSSFASMPDAHRIAAESATALQPVFNVDFGPWKGTPTKKTGAAAAGAPGDFWNTVAIAWNDNHIETGMRYANGEPSPIAVGLVNLGGGWGNSGKMGVKDPMLDDFNYPANNKGGNSIVTLYNVAPGNYSLYIYGHGTAPLYYGDYTVSVGSKSHGEKQTTHENDALENTKWVEGSQYVLFKDVTVAQEGAITILIRPNTATPSDAMICGLQLVQTKWDVAENAPVQQ